MEIKITRPPRLGWGRAVWQFSLGYGMVLFVLQQGLSLRGGLLFCLQYAITILFLLGANYATATARRSRPEPTVSAGGPRDGKATVLAPALRSGNQPLPIATAFRGIMPDNRQLLDDLHQTMQARLGDRRFGVAAMAASVGKGSTAFTLWMQQTVGETPAVYLRHYRLRAACEMLLQTHDTIEAIAEQTGFTDGTHFTKKFKEFYNCTPGQARKWRLAG